MGFIGGFVSYIGIIENIGALHPLNLVKITKTFFDQAELILHNT